MAKEYFLVDTEDWHEAFVDTGSSREALYSGYSREDALDSIIKCAKLKFNVRSNEIEDITYINKNNKFGIEWFNEFRDSKIVSKTTPFIASTINEFRAFINKLVKDHPDETMQDVIWFVQDKLGHKIQVCLDYCFQEPVERWTTNAMSDLVGCHTLENGLTFFGFISWGDNQDPVFFILYPSDDALGFSTYIPTDGNTWNIDKHSPYRTTMWNEKDKENFIERFNVDPDIVEFEDYSTYEYMDADAIVKDILKNIKPK